MKRIEYTTPTYDPGAQAPAGPAAAASPARSAVIAGAFVTTGLSALALLAVYFWPWARERWEALYLVSVAAGLVTAAVYGATWTRTAATRAWQIEDQERALRWRQVEEAAQATEQNLEQMEPPLTLPERLTLAGYEIFVIRFGEGLDATRAECEARGIPQATWNLVNRAFQELEIKSARKWILSDHAEALRRWRNDIQFHHDGSAMVRNASGGWRRVDLSTDAPSGRPK